MQYFIIKRGLMKALETLVALSHRKYHIFWIVCDGILLCVFILMVILLF